MRTPTIQIQSPGRATLAAMCAVGLAVFLGSGAHAGLITTWSSDTSLGLAIPDDGYDGSLGSMTSSSIEVGPFEEGANFIEDLNVSVMIDHTFVGDLTIHLQSPNGTIITLLNRAGLAASPDDGTGVGGDSSDLSSLFTITFDDQALSGMTAEQMGLGLTSSQIIGDPANGSPNNYISFPDGAHGGLTLSSLMGENAVGTWILYVGDGAQGATGALQSWSMSFQTVVPSPAGLAVLAAGAGVISRRRRRD